MKTLRAGIIGLGMGRHHVDQLQKHPGAQVVALADLREDRLEAVGNQYGVAGRYTDHQEMLDREALDVVAIATPNATHMPLTVAALQAGCHVVCEKPMALNAEQARAMLDAARETNRRLMIDFSFRFNPASWSLKQQVDEGVLGDVYFARTVWHRRRGMPGFGGWFGQKAQAGGGPLIDLGVHRLDLALWLMGYPQPKWVMGRTYNHLAAARAAREKKPFDVEDLAVGMVTFANGATLEVEASWAAHIGDAEQMETRLLGTRGGLVQFNSDAGYRFDAAVFTERNGLHYDIKTWGKPADLESPVGHFVTCILEDRPHVATGEEGLIVMEILDAIYRSAAKEGEPVLIAP